MVVQWWLLISWIRLFEGLSFYVILIIETIKDIAYFLIMFFICICMFATAIYILNRLELYIATHVDITNDLSVNSPLSDLNSTIRLLQDTVDFSSNSIPEIAESEEPEEF